MMGCSAHMEPSVPNVMNEGEERSLVCITDDDACHVVPLGFTVKLTPCMFVCFLMLSHIAWTRRFVCFGGCDERLEFLKMLQRFWLLLLFFGAADADLCG